MGALLILSTISVYVKQPAMDETEYRNAVSVVPVFQLLPKLFLSRHA